MKSYLFPAAILFFATLFITTSCQKTDDNSKHTTSVVKQMTETELINSIKSDPDWKLISTNASSVIEKFIIKKIDLNKFDFTNEEAFLKVIDMNRTTYLSLVAKNKEAAKRLVSKYNISSKSCESCSTANNSPNRAHDILLRFQSNPNDFQRFRTNALGIGTTVNGITPNTVPVSCCGGSFYLCVGVCAATIEAFPVYLICCGGCYGELCCS